VPNRQAKRRLGYCPKARYFLRLLTPGEFLDLVAALFRRETGRRRARADRLIERVGLSSARGRPLRKFSKAMLKRIGIAQP